MSKGEKTRKTQLPESEEYLQELLKRICRNEAPMEIKKKEASEPLYLART